MTREATAGVRGGTLLIHAGPMIDPTDFEAKEVGEVGSEKNEAKQVGEVGSEKKRNRCERSG